MFSFLGLGREYWNERPLDSMLSSLVSHFMGVVLVGASMAEMKHYDQKQLGQVRAYLSYTCRSLIVGRN